MSFPRNVRIRSTWVNSKLSILPTEAAQILQNIESTIIRAGKIFLKATLSIQEFEPLRERGDLQLILAKVEETRHSKNVIFEGPDGCSNKDTGSILSSARYLRNLIHHPHFEGATDRMILQAYTIGLDFAELLRQETTAISLLREFNEFVGKV
jgi:hypothetical protein